MQFNEKKEKSFYLPHISAVCSLAVRETNFIQVATNPAKSLLDIL